MGAVEHGVGPVPRDPSTVGRLLERTASRLPDKLALTFGGRRWSYAEFNQAAGRVAAALLARGISPGDRVAAFGRNSDAYVLLFLGCARAGLVHVPINYNAKGDELVYLLTQSSPVAAFHDPSLGPVVEEVRDRLGDQRIGTLRDGEGEDDVLSWALDESAPAHEEQGVSEEDLVQLLYTSGTTARAKGAMLTHRAFVHEYASAIAAFELTQNDVQLASLPLYHSGQMHTFTMPCLAMGATSHVIETPDLDVIFEIVPREGITSLFAAPTVWVAMANHPGFPEADLSGIVKAYYGASIMPVPVLKKLQAQLPESRFFNCFGQSEAGPLTCVLRPEEHAERPDSIGRSVLFVETRVVDDEMNDVAPGEVGEVIYRSPQLCVGYWDKPEETEAAFRGGWFHSGDLVRIDEEGYLFVVDRIRDVINTGGVLVASREVEDALYTHEAVAEVAVVGLPHERWIEAITAVVVTNRPVEPQELVDHARQTLAAHKVPKAIHFADELPKNASGKLLKRELREQLGGSAEAVGRTDLSRSGSAD
jgi:fatty-acyl-CoA synthase